MSRTALRMIPKSLTVTAATSVPVVAARLPLSPLSTFFHTPINSIQRRSISSSSLLNTTNPRYVSADYKTNKPVEFAEMKQITQSPNDTILLIDVREPDEVALGSIPSSVNLPLSSFEKSLSMDEGDFTRVHGFHKPDKNQQIIFYCRSGKRSTTALDLAKKRGYKALRNYEGSYLDWAAKASQDD